MTTATQPPQKWTCVHLSDIHFRAQNATGEWEVNLDIRDQLLEDLASLRLEGQTFNAILVSGDIAFSGQLHEYDDALDFLHEACDLIEIPRTEVWVIPGNHDVNRSSLRFTTQEWHRKIKVAQNLPNRQEMLDQVIKLPDLERQELILGSLSNYNQFASRFQCSSTFNPILSWEAVMSDPLNDGTIIKIKGINSAFICDQNDHPGNSLMLGLQQHRVNTEADTIWIVMCHHPSNWLADGNEFMTALRARASVALFGHEHTAVDIQQNNLLVLHAGAVNPERNENAVPSYNLLSFWVNDQRQLCTDVQRRTYRAEDLKFFPYYFNNGQKILTHYSSLPTSARGARKKLSSSKKPVEVEPEKAILGGEQRSMSDINEETVKRQLNYYLFDLTEGTRMQVAHELNLITSEVSKLNGADLFLEIINEAQRRNKLIDLWEAVAQSVSDMPRKPISGVK